MQISCSPCENNWTAEKHLGNKDPSHAKLQASVLSPNESPHTFLAEDISE